MLQLYTVSLKTTKNISVCSQVVQKQKRWRGWLRAFVPCLQYVFLSCVFCAEVLLKNINSHSLSSYFVVY